MCRKKWRRQKIIAIGIAHMRPELQVFCQCCRSDLGLYRAAGKEGRPIPFRTTLGVGVHPAGDDTTTRFLRLRELVITVPLDGLARFNIDLALVLIRQVLPTTPPAI